MPAAYERPECACCGAPLEEDAAETLPTMLCSPCAQPEHAPCPPAQGQGEAE